MRIPLNRPSVAAGVAHHIIEACASGRLSGDGPATNECAEMLAKITGSVRVLLTPSCTAALEMAALLLEAQPGDEVIIPSFAFVSTANAFAMYGARPRFADVRPDTLNIDEERLSDIIGPRTRAIVALHYGGIACEMQRLQALASENGLLLIEDAAHALFGHYYGSPLGGIGELGALSFHETKNVTCGEGGALLVNDPQYIERAEILREKGTDRSKFFRGETDRYTWVDFGSSYLLAEPLAAMLVAQLTDAMRTQEARSNLWHRYEVGLRDWAASNGVQMPTVPPGCEHPAHLFYLLFPDARLRDSFIRHLRDRDILGTFHYLPLHLSPMGKSLGGSSDDCPITEDVAYRLVRLPLFADLTASEQDEVIQAALGFAC